jgi:LuxR family maltose regulon positive regulatory protein
VESPGRIGVRVTTSLPPTLLATKLFTPPARRDAVQRPRLYERLERGLDCKLTLVAAPAGFGKSSLLSTWVAARAGAAPALGWVSLDETDNDPLRFWSYVLAALDGVAPGSAASAIAALQSPQPPPIDAVLTSVLNAVATADGDRGDLVIVLDDYHVITAVPIHEAMGRLLEHLPPNLHFVILTRADPPLSLARLRASGQLVEVRAEDLRFTPEEIATLLTPVVGPALTGEEVAGLTARTEGWIAGLQLAALALRDRDDPSEFIRTFSGSNRFVVDYLATEVLARLPTAVQAFLLQTSILDRLCGDLADAVLERAEDGSASGRETLVALERANLFVIPLDDRREWYRYHHLFADVLRQRLAQSMSGYEIARLHDRASAWDERNGLVPEAIGHALEGKDWSRATLLLERSGIGLVVAGQVQTVLAWIDRVPQEHLLNRPRLCITDALALLFAGDLAGAESRVTDAERSIEPGTPATEAASTQGLAAAIRANIAQYTGDIAACVAFGEEVLRLLPEDEVIARTTARLHVAKAFRVTGDVSDAMERRAIEVVGPIRASGSVLGTVSAIANVARLQRMQGRLRAAAATYGEMVELTQGADPLRGLHGSLAYYVGMGAIHREWNDLDAAESLLSEAMAIMAGTRTADADDVTLGYTALARVQEARGDSAAASMSVDRLADEARQRRFVPHLVGRVAAERARLAMVAGDLSAGATWEKASGLHADDDVDFQREGEYLVLARVLIARSDRRNAHFQIPPTLRLLDRMLDSAIGNARHSSAIEILVIRALAHHAARDQSEAVEAITRAIAFAEPEGYVRRFLDEGPALETLLREARARGIAPRYIDQLLTNAATGRRPPVIAASDDAGVDALSSRELEVLRLISTGRSNAEIAHSMVVAVSTVKTHVNSIFGKLHVSSRAEAIERARELRLV